MSTPQMGSESNIQHPGAQTNNGVEENLTLTPDDAYFTDGIHENPEFMAMLERHR